MCPPGLARGAYFARSLNLRLNSVEVTRSRGNLGDKSYHSAPVVTQTQPMFV